ncbi:MAG: P1 family peptidase [Bacillota bacterium]
MKGQKRIRDYSIVIGRLKPGNLNAITDVHGVGVGHSTLDHGPIKTGVTALLPHSGNIFRDKVLASCHVINGFGKSIGLLQIEELGTIESPIVMTNTFSVGTACDALFDYMISTNEDIGLKTGTVNPVVCECNDGYLNDIRGKHIDKEHVFEAITNANREFEEGAVGAGTGMSCYQLKGGIGSASREIELDSGIYTVGTLVLTNYGLLEDFQIGRKDAGKAIGNIRKSFDKEKDGGSVIVVIATDIPMTERQLKRMSKRAAIGINKTGSNFGSDSGDIVISFTTANRIEHYCEKSFNNINMLNEKYMDDVFRAAAESTEEAVLNSLVCADTTLGRDGHMRHSLKEYIHKILD